MPIYFGNTQVSKVYIGSTPVQAAYIGSTSMFTTGPVAPTFTSVSPSSAESGQTLTITGSGFSGTTPSVTIGGYNATNLSVTSDTQLTCQFPQAVLRGSQTITITNSAGSATGSVTVIRPTISNFSPTTLAPGGDFTINGFDFTSPMTVAFILNGVPTNATNISVISANQIVCKAPSSLTAGSYNFYVQNANSNGSTVSGLTIGGGTPTFSSISPSSGSAGSTVTISGTNFVSGSTTVSIGGLSAGSVSVSSSTSLTCTVPSGLANGTTYSVVINNGTNSVTASNAFTFYAAPTYSSISPSSGSAGTTVTISGSNFISGNTSVTIGGTAATSVSVSSSTSLTCVVPTLTAGSKNVVITTPGGSATGTGVFTYASAPTVSSITKYAAAIGYGTITVTGTNFAAGATVAISGVPSGNISGVSVSSATSLTFTLAADSSYNAVRTLTVTTSAGSGTGSITMAVPVLTTYSTAGNYSYTIPTWATSVDVIVLGGGGGGNVGGAGFNTGGGGGAGVWGTTTISRASISSALSVKVGAAGTGAPSFGSPTNGGSSTVSATGMTTLTGNGGTGGAGQGIQQAGYAPWGGSAPPNPNNKTYNGQTYTGGTPAGNYTVDYGTGPQTVYQDAKGAGAGGKGGDGVLIGSNPGANGYAGVVYLYTY